VPLLCCACSGAQVIDVHGGSSSLFESQGGAVDIKGGSYEASFGAGTLGPRLLGSASLSKRFNRSTLTFGTEIIPFNLPTDVFDEDHYLTTLGGSIRSTTANTSLLLFGGMMSQNVDGPFFEGVQGRQPAAVFLFDGKLSRSVSVASRMILSNQVTLIESVGWRPAAWAQLAASAGVGAGKAYGAVSAKLKYSMFDLKTAYIQTSNGFRRADGATLLTAEPNRLNAELTVTPNRRFSTTLGHSSYLTPVAGSDADIQSSIDEVEADTTIANTVFSASAFHSTYAGGEDKALVLSSSRTFGPRLHVQGTYLYSSTGHGMSTSATVTNVSETLSPRWTISQTVNSSNGQTTMGFGTSFLSNLATIDADYQTYYIPQHLPSPFEQVLIVNADLNLFGRATLHGGTFVAPDGSVQHTTSANGVFVRQNDGAPTSERNSVGRFVVSGRVIDDHNQPVEGAALLIDAIPVYTDSEGEFRLTERQAHFHSLQVMGKQFLDGGEYLVVSAAHNIRSAPEEAATRTIVVVQRLAQCRTCGP
jgi:hypothetical protein